MIITQKKNTIIIDGNHEIIDVGRLLISDSKVEIKNCHFVHRIFKNPSVKKGM